MRASAAGRAAVAALGLLVALPAAAQDDAGLRRLRQLEVFENLLTETVQNYVNAQVNAGIEEERNGAASDDAEPLVVKLGAALGAHGMYIDGYGVIFSIQRPQVSVLPRSFAIHLQEPLAIARWRMEPQRVGDSRAVGAGMLRFQSAMIQRQLREMQQLLEEEIAADADDAQIGAIRAEVEQLRKQMADVENRFVAITGQSSTAPPPPDEEAPSNPDIFGEVLERQRSMQEVLENNLERVRGAVNDAATDTLAHWGRVLTGLDDDDRLSVLVLPPAPWGLAQRHGVGVTPQEYVISVRYRDVRDFDDGKIDLDEFRTRARIHDRLGLELVGTGEQER